MTRIEQSVVINRPIEEVFAFASDPEKLSQWAAEVVDVEMTSKGPLGVGTTFNAAVKLLGRRMDNGHKITEYEPNRRYSIKVTSGPVSGDMETTFESVDGETKVTMVAEIEAGGFFRVAEPLLARAGQRQYATNLANLKDLLEAEV